MSSVTPMSTSSIPFKCELQILKELKLPSFKSVCDIYVTMN